MMVVTMKERFKNSALDIAKYIICIAQDNGDNITNLKLQKLLYYAQAWFLVNNENKKLFTDSIIAWQYSPVVQVVYDEYKSFGRLPIELKDYDGKCDNLSDNVKTYLNEFCETFLDFSATALASMTHQEEPWIEAISKGYGSEVNTDTMYNFYSKMLRDEEE